MCGFAGVGVNGVILLIALWPHANFVHFTHFLGNLVPRRTVALMVHFIWSPLAARTYTHTATRKIYEYYFLSDRCSLTCTRLTADCARFAGTGIVLFFGFRDGPLDLKAAAKFGCSRR